MAGARPLRGARGAALAAGIAVVGAVAAAPAPAGAATPARLGAAVVDRVAQTPASVRAYWTQARMRAAQPAPVLAVKAPGAAAAARRPARAADARGVRRRAAIATPVPKVRRKATRTHGKVFFAAGANEYECSGTAVRSGSRSLVLTAGHCAYLNAGLLSSGNAIHNWIFVPAYAGGRAPFGKWAAASLAAPAAWVSSNPTIGLGGEVTGGDSRFDLGAATVAITGGRTLQARVGGTRVGFDRPRRHRYTAFGYPAEGGFSGRREFACDSPFLGVDQSFGAPPPIHIRCDMTAGASGGGWIDPHGRLVSVTSYSYSNDSRSLYGPYFGTALRNFYGSVSGGY